MYIESVLKGYKLIRVPENTDFRKTLQNKNDEELIAMLESYKTPHNISDTEDRDRLIRAIEIADYYKNNPGQTDSFPRVNPIIFGVYFDRKAIRERITERLEKRLEQGMIQEVEDLLQKGLTPEQLKFYGLEYKYLTQFVTGEITYDEMFRLLNTAIHQFAKRQMTWFRRMERQGFRINWIDGSLSMEQKIAKADTYLNQD
jgi:tRNA dimethylallyltransferase